MPIKWKVDPIALLKESGYSSYRIRQEALLGAYAMKNLRSLGAISFKDLATICRLTGKQPGKLLEYVPDEK